MHSPILRLFFLVGSLALLSACSSTARNASPTTAPVASADIVVYGDTSGGVIAAVQASREGKSVILVSNTGHLGGLTSNGLGWVDLGNQAILGGLSREFFHRVYLHYQQDAAWDLMPHSAYGNRGQGGIPAFDAKTRLASVFEPKVAERIFDQFIAESRVRVIEGRIDQKQGADKTGARLTALRLDNGARIAGRMFIDASYEGDLLAAAGVSFRVGREARAEYGETVNGITVPAKAHQLPDGVDPYIVKGDPSSGLLPGINPDAGGPVGGGDHRLQAYCFRMTLTKHAPNRVPVEKPAAYREADYELLFRFIEAGQRDGFFTTSGLPNYKTDSNNRGGVSTDFIGRNYGPGWDWTTLTHTERDALAARHRDWQLGLIWTLQNHPRVPAEIRKAYAEWGLAKDEYPDNDHWPRQLYVREGRRLTSDFVMTEAHCRRQKPVDDSVGLGAYTLDSHHVQRIVHNGMVKNEGDVQSGLGGRPYGISYRSIVPKAGECENLLVPWALSATHIAFGSIRMEPVFMILSQSAATAAAMSIDAGIPVQQVPYATLRARLEKDGQVLDPTR